MSPGIETINAFLRELISKGCTIEVDGPAIKSGYWFIDIWTHPLFSFTIEYHEDLGFGFFTFEEDIGFGERPNMFIKDYKEAAQEASLRVDILRGIKSCVESPKST